VLELLSRTRFRVFPLISSGAAERELRQSAKTELASKFDLCSSVLRATLHQSKVAGWRARELWRIAHG